MNSTPDLDRLAVAASRETVERAYWLAQLAHPVKSSFPFDFSNEKGKRSMEEVMLYFSPGVAARLLELSNGSDVKLNMVLNAAAVALLYKYTGESDIITAAPIYRQQVESEFINTVLLLRNRLDVRQTFKELLREVRQTIADAAAHQNFPVLLLPMPGLLNLPGSGAECPLFDVAVLLRNIHDPLYIAHTNHNVAFDFHRAGQVLEGVVQYNAQFFRRETMALVGRRFARLLEIFIFNVDLELGCVDMLTGEERQTILQDFNDTEMDYPAHRTLHGLFEEQAERTPDHIAVIGSMAVETLRATSRQQITYRQLNKQSGQLAGLLVEKGVLADDIVAIMIERSIEMIIGLLGILKSGGAYLPIDPECPRERFDYMLKDSAAKILLTEVECVFNFHHSSFIIHHSNLSYVLYTSGSTGRPRGVMVEHGNVVGNIYAFYREFGINDRDCGLQLASYTFDLFAEEIYPLLLRGGKIVIPHPEEVGDIQRLVASISRYGVTIVDTTPLLLSEFNKRAAEISARPGGRGITFISGGDVLKHRYVDRLAGLGRVYNTYGPTETTVCAAYYRYKPGESGENISIGKPIANYHIYILDRLGALQPVGIAGELCIAGVGVARGYLNNPELSDEKFKIINYKLKIINGSGALRTENFHHSSFIIHHSILYRTGDLARWLADGNIQYLGRIDRQVKIRGFRVELGEIENRLTMHGGVKEAVVTDGGGSGGDRFFCAYVVCSKDFGASPTMVEELKEHLARMLPAHMIPTYFMVIEKIPLTPNGKIDRAALPEPVITPGAEYVEPRNEVEEKIGKIWEELFGREGIGIDDDFFLLGGHSLKGIRMIDDLQAEFKVKIPLVELFNTRTIRGLAACIEKRAVGLYWAMEPAEQREYYPLSPAQKRLYVLWQLDRTGTAYNMPQTAPVNIEKINKEELEKIIKLLIQRHESFRTSFVTVGDEPVQRIHDNADFAIEIYDLAAKNAKTHEEETKAIIKSFIRPFDLSKAPLLRVGLMRAAEGKYILMKDMHHIISDDISHEILARDFAALQRGEVLPALELQYKDYAVWRNSPRQTAVLELQEQFWLKEFSGQIPGLNMPTDFPRPLNTDYEGSVVGFHMNAAEGAALREMAAAHDASVTLYMALLAIFTVFLARICGQEDIIIGAPVSDRQFPELQPVIGMFIDTLALRNYPEGGKTFSAFLQEVKERFLQAFENRGYPLEVLVEKTILGREPNRNPLFDVMFTFHTVEQAAGADSEEAAEFHYYERVAAKFDLTLIVVDKGFGLSFNFRYGASLFKREKIERFAGWFKKIVSEVVRNPLMRISDISLTTPQEKEGILSQLEMNLRE
ncbi:MAG: amino acid adenylation domain-containing protein [Candidatus Aminicenantes bacterium]|nr:amino acid adenylation domain-containing protein [Candidatus Aminicenantes bacterium]